MNNDIIAKQLQREFERANDFTQQGNLERKHQMVKLSRKTDMFARILPLGDIWFACRFDMAFINVPGLKAVVTLSRSNEDNTQDDISDDELSSLLAEAISINNQYRKLVGNNNAPDLVNLNAGNKYNFSINHRVEFVGIPLVSTPQGGFAMAHSQTGQGYELVNYQVSLATYLELIQKLHENYLINQQPFSTPLKFITNQETYPVSIKMDSTGKHYGIDVRSDIPLPTIGEDYLAKDASGNFVNFDNPYLFNRPTKETSPSFYKRVVQAVKPLVEQGREKLQEMQEQGMPSSQPSSPAQFPNTMANTGMQEQGTNVGSNQGSMFVGGMVTEQAPQTPQANTQSVPSQNPASSQSTEASQKAPDNMFEGFDDVSDLSDDDFGF